MAQTSVTKTFKDLLDDTELELYRATERPAPVVMGSSSLASGSSTVFDLTTGTLNVGDVVQFDRELMTVTMVTSGTYTVIRQWDGSPSAGAVAAGTVGAKQPTWPRHRIGRAVRYSLLGLAAWIPNLTTEQYTLGTSLLVELPSNTVDVLEVVYQTTDTTDLRTTVVGSWEFLERLPTSVVTSGKALTLPSGFAENDKVLVTRAAAWRWVDVSGAAGSYTDDPAEEDTVTLPYTAADLPVMWAAAVMVAGREISRDELDSVSEWDQAEAIRRGVNLRLVRDRWSTVYRRVDEVRRTIDVPKVRPYVRMPKGMRW